MGNIAVNKKSGKKKSVERRYMIIGFFFLMPAIATYLLFMGYPLYRTFVLSLTNWSGFGIPKFLGLSNFRSIFEDNTFTLALKNTIYFAVFSSVFSVLLGLILSWLNMYMRRMEGQVYRTIMFAPSMIAPTITGLLFLFIFTEDVGMINNILKALGLSNLTTAWLTNTLTVRQVVVIATIWRQFGLTLVLFYAGLQSIPNELIESARIDGASDGKVFVRILAPLIKPQIELATMFTMLGGLRIYDSVVSLTGGGPARQTVVLPMWIVENAYTYSKFGYASAMCVIFIAVVLLFIAILRLVFRGENYEY
jgi:ABC-type sugar transport system permease subunit